MNFKNIKVGLIAAISLFVAGFILFISDLKSALDYPALASNVIVPILIIGGTITAAIFNKKNMDRPAYGTLVATISFYTIYGLAYSSGTFALAELAKNAIGGIVIMMFFVIPVASFIKPETLGSKRVSLIAEISLLIFCFFFQFANMIAEIPVFTKIPDDEVELKANVFFAIVACIFVCVALIATIIQKVKLEKENRMIEDNKLYK